MAKLQSDDLNLEIVFNSFEDYWIAYEIKFFWKDDIIINDSVLKRDGEWLGKRRYGTFLANDYEKDHLIDVIRKVLSTNESDYWEPVEPDVLIAIYPEMFFPFIKSHWILVEDGELKQIEKEKQEKGKSPDDLFTIITFIDTFNFKNSGAYSGQGMSLHMIVKRKDLEKFVTELETEYKNVVEIKHLDRKESKKIIRGILKRRRDVSRKLS